MKPTRRLSRSTKSSRSLHPPEDHTSGVRRASKDPPVPAEAAVLPPNMRPTVKLGRVKQPVETKASELPTIPPPGDGTPVASPGKRSVPPSRRASALTRASLDAVAYLAITPAQMMKRSLDPQHAFVLGLLDGRTNIESLIDACPLSTTVVLSILNDLLKDGIIALR